jgi:RNA polymerase sigma-70 factor (ECF subfamily)
MSVPSEESLRDALIATGKRDADAFNALYEQVSPSLFALALRITRHRATAEDVLRDAFVTIWQTAGQFDPAKQDALATLTSTVRSLALDRAAHGMSRPAAIATPIAELERRTLDRLSDDSSGHLLRSALLGLPEGERRVVLLAFLDGSDYEEISLSLDLAPGTISAWIKRALHKLRRTAS